MTLSFGVVIPTFNRADVLPRAIESVLGQTFEGLELIVVDDGSTDDTEAVVAGFDDRRIRYVRQENSGRSAARNRGVELSSAANVTFLDSDDEALPNWLADFARGLDREERVGIVCTGFIREEPDGSRTEVIPRPLGAFFGAPDRRGLFMARSFAVRRDLFLEVGGYVEELTFSENTELALRLVPHCVETGWEIVSLSSTGSVYHADRSEIGSPATRMGDLASSEYILRHHRDRLRRAPRVHGLYLGVAGVRAARVYDFRKSRRYFREAVEADPWNWRHYVRFLLACLPPLGRRVWLRDGSPGQGRELDWIEPAST